MDDDPWHWLNFRYENDDIARCELVLDAIEDVVKQARSSTVASLRMGLITADYAADVLLARRVARIMALSEEGPFFEPRKRFDSRARSLLRQGFNRRVAVGANDYSRRFTFGLGTPILDKSDAEVLRVAHAYRNDVYHEDRHNEDTLLAIVTATVHTVARMWPRSLSSKVGTSREPTARSYGGCERKATKEQTGAGRTPGVSTMAPVRSLNGSNASCRCTLTRYSMPWPWTSRNGSHGPTRWSRGSVARKGQVSIKSSQVCTGMSSGAGTVTTQSSFESLKLDRSHGSM
jgi:hypothetical protein